MATKIRIKKLAQFFHFMLGQYQSFSMCCTDAESMHAEIPLVYGIDGYDLATMLLPAGFFVGEPDPHRNAVLARWDTFFARAKPDTTYATISPLTLFELFTIIRHSTKTDPLVRGARQRYSEIFKLLDKLARQVVSFESVEDVDRKLMAKLYQQMQSAKTLDRILRDEGLFGQIRPYIRKGLIRGWDFTLKRSVGTTAVDPSFQFDEKRMENAISYLSGKEGRTSAYSQLDIMNYVLYDNLRQLRQQDGDKLFITSSGILTRNAWFITKYGSLPDTLDVIPGDWSARSADVPSYLMRAHERLGGDLTELDFFVEEAKTLARVILRDLMAIPELKQSRASRRDRERLYRENPAIKIRNSIGQAGVRFQRDYHRFVAPELADRLTVIPEIPFEKTDIEALLAWMTDTTKRAMIYQQTIESVRDEVHSLELVPPDWHSYVAPLGQDALEIMETFSR